MIPVKSDLIHLTGAGNSCQGGRPENQDDWGFLDTPLGFLLVVCDGMGGGPGGKTASEVAKKAFAQCIHSSNEHATPEETLKMAVAKAQEAIVQRASQDPSLTGMGSTLVALLVNKDQAWIAHLGDSRCYQMRGRRMVFRTKDHSLVGELVQYKTLTEEQARTSPQSNVITRALGSTANHVAEIESVPYCKGDRFILCTDGVWGIMPQEQLLNRFSATPDAGVMADNLSKEIDNIGFAADGHHDNHTLAVVDMGENSNIQGKMTKTAKIIIAVLAALLSVSLIVNITVFAKKSIMDNKDIVLVQNEQQEGQKQEVSDRAIDNYDINQLKVEELREKVLNLEQKIRDNEAELKRLRNENEILRQEVQKESEEAKKESSPASDVVHEDNTPLGLVNAAISYLEQMRDIEVATKWEDLREKKYQLLQKAVKKLNQLKAINNKFGTRIDKIVNEIQPSSGQWKGMSVPDKADKTDKKFRNKKDIKTIIDAMIKRIETEIKDKLK